MLQSIHKIVISLLEDSAMQPSMQLYFCEVLKQSLGNIHLCASQPRRACPLTYNYEWVLYYTVMVINRSLFSSLLYEKHRVQETHTDHKAYSRPAFRYLAAYFKSFSSATLLSAYSFLRFCPFLSRVPT